MREIFPFSTRNTSIPNKKYPSPHAPNGTNLRCPFMVAYRWGWRGQEKVKAELNNFYWSFESCHIRDWMNIEMTSINHLFSKIQTINDKLYQIQYGLALKIESNLEVVFFKSQLWLRLITNVISLKIRPPPHTRFYIIIIIIIIFFCQEELLLFQLSVCSFWCILENSDRFLSWQLLSWQLTTALKR